MNRSELIEALAEHYEGSRADATKALTTVLHTISATTAAGDRVAITGFGVFERVERPARTVRNPRTGERLQAPATAVPRFRPGTDLKAYVAGSRPVPDLVVPRVPTRRTPRPSATSEPEAPVGMAAESVAESISAATDTGTASREGAPKEEGPKGKRGAKKNLDNKAAAKDAVKVAAKKGVSKKDAAPTSTKQDRHKDAGKKDGPKGNGKKSSAKADVKGATTKDKKEKAKSKR